ncbi:hypothetical protein NQF87_08360 [Bombella sp. TMW 2.2559]|uniref:Uncharacterized protein n=1 Tax=Bombella dulcis TaxID=2967339 RepID=A0ABT3WH76_9PROT|nr:hypothetical protein [Bombella dulcis]MCX5616978.1 hypothetical protein [Bombella dulcis]
MTDTTTTAATPNTVFEGIEALITNALGDHESAATKARIHAATSALSAIGSIVEPFLADHMDVQGLMNGLVKVEQGAGQIEEGVEDIIAAIHKKKDTASSPAATTNSSYSGGIG